MVKYATYGSACCFVSGTIKGNEDAYEDDDRDEMLGVSFWGSDDRVACLGVTFATTAVGTYTQDNIHTCISYACMRTPVP